jgi:DNA-binding beta-propeller fold protein YncE
MKKFNTILILALVSNSLASCNAQSTFGANYLNLVETIPMPEVRGRIDHLDVNLKRQLIYVADLGNNTVEVANLFTGKIIHSIQGLDEPQGVGYIPQHEEIFVANGGSGDCYFYSAINYEKVATIHLSSDADDVRYDSVGRKIYVGYGSGGIAVVDADSRKVIGDIKLPAHPESFQIDKRLNRLFVNLPDANMVGVVDLNQLKLIEKWTKESSKANFPMALDPNNQRVFVGYRHPAKLVVFDSKTGNKITSNTMAGDADDLYYDDATKCIIVSGGEGYINLFKQADDNTYKQIANIPSRNGARTSLLVPEFRVFVLACRALGDKSASLQIYKLANQAY